VLVVEDESIIALDLALRLERMGYRVVGRAASASEALAKAESSLPDVVLMDIVLKGGDDGIETARDLQQRMDTAIVFLTAYGDDVTLKRARNTNPYGYLLKPIRDEELRCTIELAVHKRGIDTTIAQSLARSRSAEVLTRAQNAALDHSLLERNRALDEVNGRLAEATLELQQALRSKDVFLTRMSHELRTPLSSIVGFTDTLLMGLHGSLTDEQKRHLATIQRSGEHLLSLINDLLDLSRVRSGEVELTPEMILCSEKLEQVVAVTAPLATAKGLRLTAMVESPRLTVRADDRALQQILLNLVGNAIKFTAAGEVCLFCRERMEPARRWMLFEVRDTGPGLTPEERAQIFRPFRQLAGSSTAAPHGSGLGLHLSLKLAERMGGTIGVTSTPGRGSIFTLTLPADDAAVAPSTSGAGAP
jgi:signal transduction histidine kinase